MTCDQMNKCIDFYFQFIKKNNQKIKKKQFEKLTIYNISK